MKFTDLGDKGPDFIKEVDKSQLPRKTMGLDASLDQHFNDKKHLLNPGVAHRGQLVTIIKVPGILDLLPGETFEVSSSDADGVTLKHGLGTKFDNVKFPHGTYKIAKAQGMAEGSPQSMGTALANALSRVEPGSKLDKKIRHHNSMVRQFGPESGTMTSAPDGYHIDRKGFVRLGQGVAEGLPKAQDGRYNPDGSKKQAWHKDPRWQQHAKDLENDPKNIYGGVGKKKVKEQGVAEETNAPTKYRATVEYGPTAADAHFVTVTATSTEEAEAKVQAWCKKKGVRNPMITINGADKPVGVEEGSDPEYDDEAGMAKSNLRTMARAVNGLIDTIDDDENLPEWAQEKLAKAEMMTTGVWDYLLSQEEQGIDPQVDEASLASMRDYFSQTAGDSVEIDNDYGAPERKKSAIVPPQIQALINKMYHVGKITPVEFETLQRFQAKTGVNIGLKIKEAGANPYAIGMSQAMKSTGDKPPLKKSTINKAHEIARAIKKGE